jgi:hypothetical protein
MGRKSRRRHAFGWALRRLMDAPNVQCNSQEELSEKLKAAGHDISQQIISDYMRNRVIDGEVRPRAMPTPEFLLKLDDTFKLTDEQWEDLTTGWFAILTDSRRAALRRMSAILANLEEDEEDGGSTPTHRH